MSRSSSARRWRWSVISFIALAALGADQVRFGLQAVSPPAGALESGDESAPVVATCGGPLMLAEGFAGSRAVSASDADGRVVSLALTSVTPASEAGAISLGSFLPAAAAGDTATATVEVDAAVSPAIYSVLLTAQNDDATPASATCTLTVEVVPIVPIGTVQGAVADAADGLRHRSPYAPSSGNGAGTRPVAVKGVVYQSTLAHSSAGNPLNGFFLQNTVEAADDDATSSDGIFVFMGSASTLPREGGGAYTPQVGDEIVLVGRVSEFFNLTQLSAGLRVFDAVTGEAELDTDVVPFEVSPPDNLAEAHRYWERHEGMLARVPADSVALSGRDVFASTADSEIWLARGDSAIAQRTSDYESRAFRDAHPLDNDPARFDDGNGYRIVLGGLGVKALTADNTALLPPARTFDTLAAAVTGGVYFSFGKYQVQVSEPPVFEPGADPALNAPPQVFDRGLEYGLATYNVENLYDFRDDPFDACDFTGNAGCPGVTPPFDYVPATEQAYRDRLEAVATQIVTDLHAPDILFVQEVEDQDICAVAQGALQCGTTDDADGRPDALQELALVVEGLGGPAYEAAADRDGIDNRGILSGYLYRTDRVERLEPSASDPVLGSAPAIVYRGAPLPQNTDVQNPKALNAVLPADVDTSTGAAGSNVFVRAALVGLFRVWDEGPGNGVPLDLYAVNNHFVASPDRFIGQRIEEARYNAAIVAALRRANENVFVAVGGDLNVFPRPDDVRLPGRPHGSDQLAALYGAGLTNLYDAFVAATPAAAYGSVFQGEAETLDQFFVTAPLAASFVQVRSAHVNADWPDAFDGDEARGLSGHDPVVARFCRDLGAPEVTVTLTPDVLWPPDHKMVTVEATVDVEDADDPNPAIRLVSVTSSEPDDGLGDGDTTGDIEIVDTFTLSLRAERSGRGDGRIYTVTYEVGDTCGNRRVVSARVSVPHDQGKRPAAPPPGRVYRSRPAAAAKHRALLAEGATGSFFDTRLALFNPEATPAKVTLRFLRRSGNPVAHEMTVGARARATVWPARLIGTAEFSTSVESDVPVIVDRTMGWGRPWYGSHAERAVTEPATTWYLAEGATHSGFSLFYLIENPGDLAATVDVTFLRPSPLPPLVRTYVVEAHSRFTIWVNAMPELRGTDVAAVVRSANGVPIVLERSMYLDKPGRMFAAGHESAGVTRPATSWLLAEGATGPFFDLFVLIANPSPEPADVQVRYLLEDGSVIEKRHQVNAGSRFNIWVDTEDPRLRDAAVSTLVTSTNGVPIVVERAMWWPGDWGTWQEAHNSTGATTAGTLWALADGEVDRSLGVETYVLIANTSSAPGRARVTLHFEDGTSLQREYALGANSRTNVAVSVGFPGADKRRFAVTVESLGTNAARLVVERSMYSDAPGQVWAAGSNAVATRIR
jgi:hypothetical protein